jgi:transcriptional regulator with XRE-family HTH domain
MKKFCGVVLFFSCTFLFLSILCKIYGWEQSMKGKSAKRLLAEQLRREHGYSYNEISKQIGTSKSTLSSWLKNIALTLEQEQRIQQRIEDNQTAFVATARKTNKERYRRARAEAYELGEKVASMIPDNHAVHELALAMLYLGEGDKTGNRVQIANTEPAVLAYFLWAMEELYDIERTEMSLRLNLVEAARPLESEMIECWADALGCAVHQFQKTQFDGRSKVTHLTEDYRGVCTITYGDTYLLERLMGVYSAYFDRKLGK